MTVPTATDERAALLPSYAGESRGRSRMLARLRALIKTWPFVLAALTFIAYLVIGWWVRYGLHYAIGDALSRSADARFVINSRDPHIAAVGFVWLPFPVLAQIPFSALLSRWTRADFAGPASTALCAAIALYTVARITQDLRLPRGPALLLTLLLGANPVFIYYAVNGMSEASSFMFYLVAIRGLFLWGREGRLSHLALVAGGLAGAMLCRYETLALVPIFAAGAALQVQRGRKCWRWGAVAATVALPAIFAFALWLLTSRIIVHDAFYWEKALALEATPPTHALWLPARTLAAGLAYSVRLTRLLAPGFVVIALPLVLMRPWRRAAIGGTVVSAALVFPLYVAYGISKNQTWGNPRYYAPLSVFAVVGAAWIVAERAHTPSTRRAWLAVMSALLIANGIASTVTLSNPRIAAVEGEPAVFGQLTGTAPAQPGYNQVLPAWRRLDDQLDRLLTGRKTVAVDTYIAFVAPLLSSKPTHYIVDSDRDFQAIMSDPVGRVDYLLVPSGGRSGDSGLFAAALTNTTGGRWTRIGAPFNVGNGAAVQIYGWVATH